MYKFVAGFALIVIAFWGCKDEMNKTGYDLLLPGDLVSARKFTIDKDSISAYTVTDEKLRTNKPEFSLLGTFNDPVFGKTTTDFAYQFRMGEYRDLTNATFSALTLNLIYYVTYGDTVTPQTLKVYELDSDLNAEDTTIYYQDIDLKGMAKSEVLGKITYVPKFKLDSINNATKGNLKDTTYTVFHKIKFYLNPSLAQKLMAFKVPVGEEFPNDRFLEYFKGLYIEAGDLNQGGGIMRIVPSVRDAKLVVHDTEMKLFFYKAGDPKLDSIAYRINSTSARTSRFVHDYSTTSFAANLDDLAQQDSLIYLQTTGGLSSKIFIPSLNTWKDSTNCAINKAELILQVDTILMDKLLMPPPEKLILSLINKDGQIFEKGNLIFPSDLTLSESYYGGTYNKKDGTYRFNLALHLQEIIKKLKDKDKNYGFYLTTDEKTSIFKRVVIKGATSKAGIRFEIMYSKIK